MAERRRVLLVSLVTAIVAAGCGIGWNDEEISRVRLHDGGRTLEVEGHCSPDASIEVFESDTEVRLKLRVYDDGDDCLRMETARLDEPLGQRTVIDASTGDEVPVVR